jgi:hypothetical protein
LREGIEGWKGSKECKTFFDLILADIIGGLMVRGAGRGYLLW